MEPMENRDTRSTPIIVGSPEKATPTQSSNAVNQLAQRLLSCRITDGWNFSLCSDFSDRDLKVISSQQGVIKYLNFHKTQITGNGLVEHFFAKEGSSTRLSTLQGLILTELPYTAEMGTFLKKLSITSHQLTELYIGGSCQDNRGLGGEELAALFSANLKLVSVFLSSLVLPTASLQALGTKVRTLKLTDCQLMPNAFQGFDKKNVQFLSISGCDGLTSEKLRAIAASETLKQLYLMCLELPPDTLEILKACPNLKLLHLFDCRKLKGQWSHLLEFPSLAKLELDKDLLNTESKAVCDKLVKRKPSVEVFIEESEDEGEYDSAS